MCCEINIPLCVSGGLKGELIGEEVFKFEGKEYFCSDPKVSKKIIILRELREILY